MKLNDFQKGIIFGVVGTMTILFMFGMIMMWLE
jgi:hypothetical protein